MFDERARRAILTAFGGIIAYFVLTEVGGAIGRAFSDAIYPDNIETKTGFAGVGKVVGFAVFIAGAVALLLRSSRD